MFNKMGMGMTCWTEMGGKGNSNDFTGMGVNRKHKGYSRTPLCKTHGAISRHWDPFSLHVARRGGSCGTALLSH